MPLINGYKYSCEPCIRGHRATSCAHTDRILVEVRKPGRPLESCGHQLDTCSCGRLQDLFTFPGAPLNQPISVEGPVSFTTTPSASSSKTKQTSRKKSDSKVSKRANKKKVPSMQPATERLEQDKQEFIDPVSPEPQVFPSATSSQPQIWGPPPLTGQAHPHNFVNHGSHQGMTNSTHDPMALPTMIHGAVQDTHLTVYPYRHTQQIQEEGERMDARSQYYATEHETAWISKT